MTGIGIIGLGHWGPNYLRVFNGLENCKVVCAAEPNKDRCDKLRKGYPGVDFVASHTELIRRDDVDAVVIAVPSAMHHAVAREALLAGKHVLCEKPLTTSSEDAWDLVRLAGEKSRVLMTGHVFLFNPGIEYLAAAARDHALGSLYYLGSVRTNLGPFRSDVNVAWDLASHDVYIFNHIVQRRPEAVSAVGASYLRDGVEDVAFVTLKYPNGVLGHIHISWLDPKKVRQITMVGEIKMMTWDEYGSPGPVMVYDRSVIREKQYETFGEFQLLTREGDVTVPRIAAKEPLSAEAREFLRRCEAGDVRSSEASGRQGAEVVDILVAAARSLAKGGEMTKVSYGG